MDDRLFGFLNKNFVDDADDLTGFRVKQGTTAVAGIRSGVELKNVIRSVQPGKDFPIKLLGRELRNHDRRYRRNDGTVRDRI